MTLKLEVRHGGYGCDTGCCGYRLEVPDSGYYDPFFFEHPMEDDNPTLEFAHGLVKDAYNHYKWLKEMVDSQGG